jgi:hypothetical protein
LVEVVKVEAERLELLNIVRLLPTAPAGRCAELSIKMHHMSYVRKDIAQKLRNSSARVNIKNMEQRLKEIADWQLGQPHPFMPQHNIIEVPILFE